MSNPTGYNETLPASGGVRYDVVILVPTDNEMAGMSEFLSNLFIQGGLFEVKHTAGGLEPIVYAKDVKDSRQFKVAVFSQNMKGNVSSAAITAYFCGRFSPSTIISAGIAGSLDASRAWIGDVVIPSSVETVGINKVYFDLDVIPENATDKIINLRADADHPVRISSDYSRVPNATNTNARIRPHLGIEEMIYSDQTQKRMSVFEGLKKNIEENSSQEIEIPTKPKILLGNTTFSWEKVLDSPGLYDYFVENGLLTHDPICVEMESWGFNSMINMLSASAHNPIIVRGISDIVGFKYITDQKDQELEGLCRTLALNSVAAVVSKIVFYEYGLIVASV